VLRSPAKVGDLSGEPSEEGGDSEAPLMQDQLVSEDLT
jgi:hypothetical protein